MGRSYNGLYRPGQDQRFLIAPPIGAEFQYPLYLRPEGDGLTPPTSNTGLISGGNYAEFVSIQLMQTESLCPGGCNAVNNYWHSELHSHARSPFQDDRGHCSAVGSHCRDHD